MVFYSSWIWWKWSEPIYKAFRRIKYIKISIRYVTMSNLPDSTHNVNLQCFLTSQSFFIRLYFYHLFSYLTGPLYTHTFIYWSQHFIYVMYYIKLWKNNLQYKMSHFVYFFTSFYSNKENLHECGWFGRFLS